MPKRKQLDDDDDERGVVRDGDRILVPLHMMDSLQRAIRDHCGVGPRFDDDGELVVCDAFGRTDDVSLAQPGSRFVTSKEKGTTNMTTPLNMANDEWRRLNDARDQARAMAAADAAFAHRGGPRAGDSFLLGGRWVEIVQNTDGSLVCREK